MDFDAVRQGFPPRSAGFEDGDDRVAVDGLFPAEQSILRPEVALSAHENAEPKQTDDTLGNLFGNLNQGMIDGIRMTARNIDPPRPTFHFAFADEPVEMLTGEAPRLEIGRADDPKTADHLNCLFNLGRHGHSTIQYVGRCLQVPTYCVPPKDLQHGSHHRSSEADVCGGEAPTVSCLRAGRPFLKSGDGP